jgi:hypothetical protein
MTTPTTAEQDNLRSRLPGPAQFFPEVGTIAGAMLKATLNGSIPWDRPDLLLHPHRSHRQADPR